MVDVPAYLASLKRLLEIAPNLDHVIPGHDPLVLALFPPVADATDIVRVDLPPAQRIEECL